MACLLVVLCRDLLKVGQVVGQTAADVFQLHMQQHLLTVVERAASVPDPAGAGDSGPGDADQGQLVLVAMAARTSGSSGEYGRLPPPGSWPWGPRGTAASSGSSGAGWGSRNGALGDPPSLGDVRAVLALGGMLDAAVAPVPAEGDPGVGPSPGGGADTSLELPVQPVEPGTLALGQGLLQEDALSQLIAAVIAGGCPYHQGCLFSAGCWGCWHLGGWGFLLGGVKA